MTVLDMHELACMKARKYLQERVDKLNAKIQRLDKERREEPGDWEVLTYFINEKRKEIERIAEFIDKL